MNNKRALAGAGGLLGLLFIVAACGGPDNTNSELIIQKRNIIIDDHTVVCAQIDSSRGVALSCAWPDELRDFEP